MVSVKVRLPKEIRRGDLVEVRALVSHPMESGQRKDAQGNPIPRKILNKFICTYNGREVIRMDLAPAIAANPYFSFFVRATESGSLELTYIDDDGSTISEKVPFKVV